MASRTRDGSQAETIRPPRERLLPLTLVEFKNPITFDGLAHPLRKFQRGTSLPETQEPCPKLFLDPELQAVVIEGRHFPIHLVLHYERAKAA